MRSALVITIALITLLSCLVSVPAYRLVRLPQGKLRGTKRTTRNGREISAFLGIPYAEPPIGILRFQDPLPKKDWGGTLNATRDSSECPQLTRYTEIATGNEDCLYLNVYTPWGFRCGERLLAVMVSIHGGAFTRRNGSSDSYGPEYMLDKDVVLVTLNYRLGIFGFLSTGDEVATGNFGLKDQVLALKWVQQHVRAFGGDPKMVTIFGQSAGGASVNLHALSDKSKGLFHRYIGQSGAALSPWTFHNRTIYSKFAKRVAKLYNCPTWSSYSIMRCLRNLSVSQLLNTNSVFGDIGAVTSITWGPTNEIHSRGAFLTDFPINLVMKNRMAEYSFMTGHVKDEGLFTTLQFYRNESLYDAAASDLQGLVSTLIETFLPVENTEELTKEAIRYYFGDNVSDNKYVFLSKLSDFITDGFFVWPELNRLNYLTKRSNTPVYLYNFDYRGTFSFTNFEVGHNENIGVSHSDEQIYLFPTTPASFGLPNRLHGYVDNKVIDLMVDLWTSFAKTGTPTSYLLDDPDTWKCYSDNESYLRIGNNGDPTPILLHSLLEERMKFWAKHLPSPLN